MAQPTVPRIPLNLLQKAWPEGCLPVRGVQTITGWTFVAYDVIFSEGGHFKRGVERLSYRILHHPSERHADIKRWMAEGDLLPAVNLHDVATWACILQDLARRIGLEGTSFALLGPSCEPGGTWTLIPDGDAEQGQGLALAPLAHQQGVHEPPMTPELAVVLALIQAEEDNEGRVKAMVDAMNRQDQEGAHG